MSRRAVVALLAGALCMGTASDGTALGKGRWRLAQADDVPLQYFQGLTHAPGGNVLFVGVFQGAYRTNRDLLEQARVDTIYPDDVAALGFNHVGDPTYDGSEGGRMLAPMECYRPDLPEPNTCGTGGFGVVDPQSLAWRYWVRLDPAEIPKAMWAEVSPDGALVWTSSGADLLAYRTADITPANAATSLESPAIHPVRRLSGAVPPSGVTGAVFRGGRLFLAGEVDGLPQIRSVDLTGATPTRLELSLPGVRGESEGLDVLDMRGGLLHWLLSPFVSNPTYGSGHSELLTFLPKRVARLRMRVRRTGGGAVVRVWTLYGGRRHPVAGALVRAGSRRATTGPAGIARFARVSRGRQRVRVSKLALRSATTVLGHRA